MKSEILVIDDNADIRFLICNILKEKDFTVRRRVQLIIRRAKHRSAAKKMTRRWQA